jgi:hypothetical protein
LGEGAGLSAGFAALSKPGDPFKLGVVNEINRLTTLVGTKAGALLKVDNNGAGSALQLEAGAGKPLLVVKANSGTATNLSADRLDGMDSSQLPPRGYAHISLEGNVDTNYPSKGVNAVEAVKGPGTNPTNAQNRYCFDLTFTPSGAVGSPYLTNAAVVSTVTPPNDALGSCPPGYRDAAVATYGSSQPDDQNDISVNFTVVFL